MVVTTNIIIIFNPTLTQMSIKSNPFTQMAKYLWVGGGGRGTERSLKSEEVIPDLLFMPIERERERDQKG